MDLNKVDFLSMGDESNPINWERLSPGWNFPPTGALFSYRPGGRLV
jgi:hypothetical protein